MRDKLNLIKNHIHHHRAKYAAGASAVATATAAGIVGIKVGKEWNEFLKEQGVYDAFHNIEDHTV